MVSNNSKCTQKSDCMCGGSSLYVCEVHTQHHNFITYDNNKGEEDTYYYDDKTVEFMKVKKTYNPNEIVDEIQIENAPHDDSKCQWCNVCSLKLVSANHAKRTINVSDKKGNLFTFSTKYIVSFNTCSKK